MLTANCPLPAALTSVPETTCPIDYGQVAKIAFQVVQTVPSFTAATIKVLATWSPLLAETDETKVVLTPLVSNFVFPKSEILKEGGNDNTTFNGIPMVKGLGSVEISAVIRSMSDAAKLALQSLFSRSQIIAGQSELWAYFLTSDNKVICKSDGSGIVVHGLAVSDTGSEGFGKLNENDLKFFLPGGWSDGNSLIAFTDIKTLFLKNPS